MKEPTIKKHLKEATYSQSEEQPDGKKRWTVQFSKSAGGATLEVIANDASSAHEAADEAYRNYLRVTVAIE